VLKTSVLVASAMIAATLTAPKQSGGWEALRDARMESPQELLGYDETGAALQGLALRAGLPAAELAPEAAETRKVGRYTVMSGCNPGTCEEGRAMLVGDAGSQAFYAAWKPKVGRAVVVPDLKTWPAEAKREAIAWLKKPQ